MPVLHCARRTHTSMSIHTFRHYQRDIVRTGISDTTRGGRGLPRRHPGSIRPIAGSARSTHGLQCVPLKGDERRRGILGPPKHRPCPPVEPSFRIGGPWRDRSSCTLTKYPPPTVRPCGSAESNRDLLTG